MVNVTIMSFWFNPHVLNTNQSPLKKKQQKPVWVFFLHVCQCMFDSSWGSQKRVSEARMCQATVVTDDCEPPRGCWKWDLHPLEEQAVLLATESSPVQQMSFKIEQQSSCKAVVGAHWKKVGLSHRTAFWLRLYSFESVLDRDSSDTEVPWEQWTQGRRRVREWDSHGVCVGYVGSQSTVSL